MVRVEQRGQAASPAEDNEKLQRLSSHAERKAARRAEQRRERELQQVEQRIEQLEIEIAQHDQEMSRPGIATDHERLEALATARARLQGELEACYQRWEDLHDPAVAGDAS